MRLKKTLFFLSAIFFPGLVSAAYPQTALPNQSPDGGNIVAGLLALGVVIGVLYNLWNVTRTFGGIIGQGLRRIGVGIIFLTLESLDRIAERFGGVGIVGAFAPYDFLPIIHDALLLVALFFLALGFAKFSKATKG